jgi:hypothetical protein
MDVVASDRVIKPSPPRRSARGDKAIYTVLESINGSSASQKRSGITSIAEILKQRKLPDSVLPSVIDTLQACVNGNNHKISLQALRCLKQLISRTFGHAAIKGFLPSIAETVGERWGDMKDEVRMTALDTSLDIARLSTSLRFDFFLRKCNDSKAKVRQASLSFLGQLAEDFGVSVGDKIQRKCVVECCKMMEDRNPKVRTESIETLAVLYGVVGESIWRTTVLGRAELSAAMVDVLKDRFSTVTVAPPPSPAEANEMKTERTQKKTKKLKVRPRKGLRARNMNQTASSTVSRTPKQPPVTSRFAKTPSYSQPATIRPVSIGSAKSLVEEITKLETILCTKDTDWKKRNDAMHRLQGILVGGIVKIEGYETQLRRLLEPLHVQVKELRSGVVRQACLTLTSMSKIMKSKFEPFAELYTPDLLTLTANRIGVMSKSADQCLRSIIAASLYGMPKVLLKIIDGTRPKIDKLTRARSQEYLLLALSGWSTKALEKHVDSLQQAVTLALEDRSDGVRQTARLTFWAFEVHFPERASGIFDRLSSVNQERLYKAKNIYRTQYCDSSSSPSTTRLRSPISTEKKTPDAVASADQLRPERMFHTSKVSPSKIFQNQGAGTAQNGAQENQLNFLNVFKEPSVRTHSLGKKIKADRKGQSQFQHGSHSEFIDDGAGAEAVVKPQKSVFQRHSNASVKPRDTNETFARKRGGIFEKYAKSGSSHMKSKYSSHVRYYEDDGASTENDSSDAEDASTHVVSDNYDGDASKKMSIFERYAASGAEVMETTTFRDPPHASTRRSKANKSYRSMHMVSKGKTTKKTNAAKAPVPKKFRVKQKIARLSEGKRKAKKKKAPVKVPEETPADGFAHPSMSKALQILESYIEKLEEVVWSKRLEAFKNIDSFLTENDCTYKRCATQLVEKLCRGVEKHLPDSHHRVSQAALKVVNTMVNSSELGNVMFQHLDVLLPCLFITLAEKRENLKQDANRVLDLLRKRVEADQLARVLCSVADHRSVKARVGCQEYLLHIIPSASQTFKSSTFMRLAVRKTCENLEEKDSALRSVSGLVLHALYKVNRASFLSQVVCLEANKRATVMNALRDYVSDLNERLKGFVRKGTAALDQGSSEASAVPAAPQAELYNFAPPLPTTQTMPTASNSNLQGYVTIPGLLSASKSERADDRMNALAHIVQLAKPSKSSGENWIRIHSQVLSIVLGSLKDPETHVQLRAVETLRGMLKFKTSHMLTMLDVVLHNLLECLKSSASEMCNALGNALDMMVSVFPASRFMRALLPILQTSKGIALQYALNLSTKTVARMASGTLLDALPDIMPPIIIAMNSGRPELRKESVFCFVAVYLAVGEDVLPYFEQLTQAQRKLTTIYINRASQK